MCGTRTHYLTCFEILEGFLAPWMRFSPPLSSSLTSTVSISGSPQSSFVSRSCHSISWGILCGEKDRRIDRISWKNWLGGFKRISARISTKALAFNTLSRWIGASSFPAALISSAFCPLNASACASGRALATVFSGAASTSWRRRSRSRVFYARFAYSSPTRSVNSLGSRGASLSSKRAPAGFTCTQMKTRNERHRYSKSSDSNHI